MENDKQQGDLDFADHLVFRSNTKKEAQTNVGHLKTVAKGPGLKINVKT